MCGWTLWMNVLRSWKTTGWKSQNTPPYYFVFCITYYKISTKCFPVPHVTLGTPHFALHSSHSTLQTLHFISSHLSFYHFISPHLSILFSSQMSSKFFSTVFVSPEHCSTFRISSKLFLTHLSASVRQQVFSVREKLFYTKTVACRKLFHGGASCFQTRMRLRRKTFTRGNFTQKIFPLGTLYTETFTDRNFFTEIHRKTFYTRVPCTEWQLNAQNTSKYYLTLYYKPCTQHLPVLLRTTRHAQSTPQCSFVYYKKCTKHVPVRLCTTKLSKSPSTTLYYKASTKHFPVLLQDMHKVRPSTTLYLQRLHRTLPSTTLYHKACTKHLPLLLCTASLAHCAKYFPVLLPTTKLAQSTSQYYFVLQDLHKVLPSPILYYKPSTKYFSVLLRTTRHTQRTSQYYPVLLCTTRIAQSTSQYDFVLQDFHKIRPGTTLYYKAFTKAFSSIPSLFKTCAKYVPVLLCTTGCTKHFPVLLCILCTTSLACTTSFPVPSNYYFVVQSLRTALPSLRKVLPSTTVYYKACTKYCPVLLWTTRHAQSTFQYYVLHGWQNTHKERPSITLYYKACTQKVLHRNTFTLGAFAQRNGYTENLHGDNFTPTENYYKQATFTHRRFYKHMLFYTQQTFTRSKLLH